MNKMSTRLNAQIRALTLTSLMLLCAAAGCLGGDPLAEEDPVVEALEPLVIAYEVRDDYTNVDENPQALADYLAEKLNYDVSLYNVDSEGAMIEALRFGNADIAIMDGGAAWVGWQQYDLQVLAADQKSDGRAFYNAHAWVRADSEMATAATDNDTFTDPFALLSGKTSCHTGWLKSAGMLLPMGYLIGHGYANVVGDPNDVETLRNTIHGFFNENASIPDSGTPYYGYSGAVKCLSEGVGDVAFAKDSTIDSYCGNDNSSENEDWCLARDQYVALPTFGQAPSHPVMYNPEFMDTTKANAVRDALLGLSSDPAAASILDGVLNTPGIISTTTEEHLGSYSASIGNIPGISAYYNGKFSINASVTPTIDKVRIAYEVKSDYENIDENPQLLADYLAAKLGVEVELYNVDSEGAIIEALRFGNADIGFMDGGAAWVGWKEYGLAAMAADQKSDQRTYYNAHAWVRADSDIATAHLDGDDSTDPFALLAGKTSCHTGWLKSAGMLLPMGYLIGNGYADVVGDTNDVNSLRDTIHGFFNENASIPDSGTPYYGYSGAVKCLSEGVGDVAFAKDSTVDSYCGSSNASENEAWCLARDQYIALPAFGQAPSHPVMYNPDRLDMQTRTAILNALMSMNNEMYVENYSVGGSSYTGCYDITTHVVDSTSAKNTCGSEILDNILNTPGLVRANTQEHLGSYSSLISNVPGISAYYDTKFDITSA
ncbi:MAG: PhnD/SsuA/transferrin family substrate-binding protein [Candidatus Thalassarchaeaceae archaeon]|nr:PhnD/SsuA/transferrin family substrate-binding protein [Candidatus Thalassarchaeaceae archaeon]